MESTRGRYGGVGKPNGGHFFSIGECRMVRS